MGNDKYGYMRIQLILFNFLTVICYILIAVRIFITSNEAGKLLITIEFYLKLYMSLYLIWRFNMYRKHINITDLDRQIIYGSAFFILFIIIINKILLKYEKKIKSYLQKKCLV
jgi:hypothetical protein